MSNELISSRRKLTRRGRGTRVCMSDTDDLPLSLLALLTQKTAKRTKKTPQKNAKKRSAETYATPITPAEVINIDDTPEATEIANNVHSKIDDFMQSGGFVSSDEDEEAMIKAKTLKKPSPNPLFISDDSDDDCNLVQQSNKLTNFDSPKPGTSAGCSSTKQNVECHDVIDLDEIVINNIGIGNGINEKPKEDLKSLEDYRKETEELLKRTNTLLDNFKKPRKPDPVETKEESSSSKVTVTCPICFESLAGRAASVTVCGHIFCKECITHTAQTLKKCPTCRKGINNKKIHPIYF